ncbi:hypothetical protein J5N97_011287 [Dioscorea zingiberensis]|uniref:Rab3GAP catalytic subunit conserved domain-containing protein n=1 Tax=Dioscorea zingiberensis TaxID=325984 RepID=A0A9D5D227_9LILI|nr:hypothetical protein J5N97_011287 [Dioscorea zingiberensis]
MEVSLSFVSRAKTVLHSAAAKAEKVLTDIKADLRSDRENDAESLKTSSKASDQEMVDADASSKALEEVSDKETTVLEDDSQEANNNNICSIIPSSVLRQLAVAVECSQSFNSMKDVSSSVGHPSPVREKTGLSFSTVKALVLGEKDDKLSLDSCRDDESHSLIPLLFGSGLNFMTIILFIIAVYLVSFSSILISCDMLAEENRLQSKIGSCLATLSTMNLSREIHNAPPESFVARLSEVIGGFKSLQKMGSFWLCVVRDLRRLCFRSLIVALPGNSAEVLATDSLDSLLNEANEGSELSYNLLGTNQTFYARTKSGDYVLRLGADYPAENLTMLETGEPIYCPVTQEGPILTEEIIKQTEELVLSTGSVGAGCSQLLSDMQAFKAANPGCVLEDFIRWFSPPDWRESDSDNEENVSAGDNSTSRRGRLSRRMQEEGNLWRELWETAQPLPAIRQVPLFDEDLAVESILTTLEDITPSELFEQLFVCVLSSGFLIAEATLPTDGNLSKLFKRCKDYVIATYQSGSPNENLADLCEVYETVEKIMTHPEEAILIMDQAEETKSGETNSRFKKISLNFLSKDRQPSQKAVTKDENHREGKRSHVFSRLLDKKTYLFSKKHAKPNASSSTVPSGVDGIDWTLV